MNGGDEGEAEFETHLTLDARVNVDRLGQLADRLGLKLLHIVLDQGDTPSQPMVSFTGQGSLREQKSRAKRVSQKLRLRGFKVVRTKIEAAWENDVWLRPPHGLYFEFHLKIRIDEHGPSIDDLRSIAASRGAHLSRNAISKAGGVEQRFVTLRSERLRTMAADEFQMLNHLITTAGFIVAKVEREQVVYDSNLDLDRAWLPNKARTPLTEDEGAAAKSDWPRGFPTSARSEGSKLFDPALTHYTFGFRQGEPDDVDTAWHDARQAIFARLLAAVAASELSEKLVARGSALLPHWLGPGCRLPGDIDWVVYPSDIAMNSEEGRGVLHDVKQLLFENSTIGQATLCVDQIATDGIWTYDRVPGQRLTVPWSIPGHPQGTIQMDFVFEEQLWEPPMTVAFADFVPGTRLLTASPELSLAWKLMWLASDIHPQGKDLYDAVLLAERYPIDKELFYRAATNNYENGTALGPNHEWFGPDLPMRWPVDWDNFVEEYPDAGSSAAPWKRRLCEALRSGFAEG